MTTPAWMQAAAPHQSASPYVSAQAPASMYNRSDDIDQIATAAVLEQQEAEMRATLAQQRYYMIMPANSMSALSRLPVLQHALLWCALMQWPKEGIRGHL